MGVLDIPESYRDLFFYASTIFVNVCILTISIIVYQLKDADYTKTGLYLIPGFLAGGSLVYYAYEHLHETVPDRTESAFKKLVRSMTTTSSIVVGSVLVGKYILGQDAEGVETILLIVFLSVALIGDIYNERENTVDSKSWEVNVSKYAPAFQFGYMLIGLVFILNIIWMKDFLQFASSNVDFWVFGSLTLAVVLLKSRLLWVCCGEPKTENILLKQLLNNILLFSSAMVYSLSGKLHEDEGDVLAENSKDRNSLMIVSQIGLWMTILITSLNKINIGENKEAVNKISVEKESEFVTLQF